MILKGIVLKCFSHIQDERTSAAIYHMIQGKRSIQTIHDAHLFNLVPFYGIYRKLNKHTFEKIVIELIRDDYLTQPEQTMREFRLTHCGNDWLMNNEPDICFHYYNGLKYHTIDHVFFERLLLLIQVLTNSKMKNTNYIPVIDKPAVTNWVKRTYKSYKSNIDKNLHLLHKDLYDILARFPNKQANLFVDRLTGYKNYSMSIQQLATAYGLLSYDVQILLTGIVHQILNIINEDESKFPFISNVIDDLSAHQPLTQSASITQQLLNKHDDIEKIANIRKLTLNTIYDHIVEIALHSDDFKIAPYVNELEKHAIILAVEQANTSKLRHIKTYLTDDISYFQIRLILATYHNVVKMDGEA